MTIEKVTIYDDPEGERIVMEKGEGEREKEMVRIKSDGSEKSIITFTAQRLEVIDLPITMEKEVFHEWMEDDENKVHMKAKSYRQKFGYN